MNRPLRVLQICHTDAESGAGRAAYRLHRGLRAEGVDSRMLVGYQRSGDSSVYAWGRATWNLLRTYIDAAPNYLFWRESVGLWSNMALPRVPFAFRDGWKPDLVNIHWVGGGYASWSALQGWDGPLVWTLHDMRFFTGGCHYSSGCERFLDRCGQCPVLGSKTNFDLAALNQWRGRKYARTAHALVSPSRWLQDAAARSANVRGRRIELIPNGLDLSAYKPCDPRLARSLLGLPASATLIGFGAMQATSDKRKGFDLLRDALNHLRQLPTTQASHLVVFGGSKADSQSVAGFPTTFLGFLKDDVSLALALSAIDVLIVPSREDNLPQAPIEAMACGTPSVCFDVGGLPDIVRHQETGWLSPPFDTAHLATGIDWVLRNITKADSTRLRGIAEQKYSLAKQAKSYQVLYQGLLGGDSVGPGT